MAIIKLNYLQQAIELVSGDQGISKKKITDSTKVLSFRSLPVIRIKETGIVSAPVKKQPEPAARLVIQTPEPVFEKQVSVPVTTSAETNKPKARLGSLQKIREQVIQNKNNGNSSKPLTEEMLQTAWNSFIETLTQKKNHSAVTNFRMAVLKVVDENSFDIITHSNMHLKFIEAERSDLIHFMQVYFNNRLLKYQLVLEEKEAPAETGEKPLNTKQQYQKLAEEFPLIKELKDRLKLDLDF